MSDMKCPFCKEEIISDLCFMFNKKDRDYTDGRQIYKCNKCGLFGNKELWQGLIRTRKALEIAVDALKHYCTDSDNWSCVIDFTGDYDNTPSEFADKALEQITALKQKDVK